MSSSNRPFRMALGAAAVLATLFFAAPSHAQLIPRDEGFMQPPRTVQNRAYSLGGKHDLGLFFATSIKTQLTQHMGGALGYAYQFNEYLALDLLVGGGSGSLTNLALTLRDTARLTSNKGTDLEDAGSLLGTAQLGVRFTPAYGKLNLSSELPVHFNFYFNAGVGGAFVRYDSLLVCAQDIGTGTKCPNDNFRTETLPTLGVNVGGGMRFFVDQRFSLRVEVRDIIYPDRYLEDVNLKTPVTNPGKQAASPGITHVPLLMVGLGILL